MRTSVPRTIWVILLLLAAMWVGSRGPVYVGADRPGVDSGVFSAVAWHLLHGKVLYRDAWDHKPPMVHVLNAAALWAGEPSINSVRQMERLFGALAAGLAFGLAWLMFRRVWASVAASVALTAMLFHPLIFEGGNLTEEYAVTFMLAGMAAAVASRRATSRRWSAVLVGLCGAALSCAVLTKEPFLLTALPWAALAVWRSTGVSPVSRTGVSPMQRGLGENASESAGAATSSCEEIFASRDHGRDARGTHGQDARATPREGETPSPRACLLALLLGAAVPVAGFVAYFLVVGGLRDWLDVIAFNVSYTAADPERKAFPLRLVANLGAVLANFSVVSWLALLAALVGMAGVASRKFRRRTGGLVVIALIDWTMAVLATSLSGRPYGHYHLQLVPSMTLLAVFGLVFVGRRMAVLQRATGMPPALQAIVGFGLVVTRISDAISSRRRRERRRHAEGLGVVEVVVTLVLLFGVPLGAFWCLEALESKTNTVQDPRGKRTVTIRPLGGFTVRLTEPVSRWEGDAMTAYVRDRASGQRVWVANSFLSYVYPHAGVLSPTPRLYLNEDLFVDTPASTAQQKYQQIVHDIETNPPAMILIQTRWRELLDPQGLADVLRNYELTDRLPTNIDWLEDPTVEVWSHRYSFTTSNP